MRKLWINLRVFQYRFPLPRPRGSRLVEALSPKLARGRSFFGWRAFNKRIGLDSAPAELPFLRNPVALNQRADNLLIHS